MSKTIDEKVVEMRFDNKHFESNVQTTMSTLDKLKAKLNLTGASKGLENVSTAAKKVNLDGLTSGINTIHSKFSALEVVGVGALLNIGNAAANAGKRLVASLSGIQAATSGFSEYSMTMNTVQTLVNSTDASIKEVEKSLKELDEYADKTVYSTADMFNNIYKFTNAGIDLETAKTAMIGIANATAYAGQGAQQASIAYYNLAQSMSMGYLTTIDYKSLNLANIATKEFKQRMADAAVAAGTLKKTGDGLYSTGKKSYTLQALFTEGLKDQWATTNVMMDVFKQYGSQETEIGKKAWASAQEVKTFGMMMESLRAQAGTGWKDTWQILFGGLDEAKRMWTGLANFISRMIDGVARWRNTILDIAMNNPFKKIYDTIKPFQEVAEKVKESSKSLEEYRTMLTKIWQGDYKNQPYRKALVEAAGYNYEVTQSLVNLTDEMAGYGKGWTAISRITQEDVIAAEKKYGIQLENTAESLDNTKKELKELTNERLKQMGLSDDEIYMYRQLEKGAKKYGLSIDDLAKKMENATGRDLLYGSADGKVVGVFQNIGMSISNVFNAIKKGWTDVFDGFNGVDLYMLIERLNKFTESIRKMTENQDEMRKLSETFRGLFSIIHIITSIIGGGFKIAFQVLKGILSAFNIDILDFTSMIGNMLYRFDRWITENNIIVETVKNITLWIIRATIAVKDWIVQNEKIMSVIHVIANAFESMGHGIKSWFNGLKETDNIPKYIFQGLINGFKNGASGLYKIISSIAVGLVDTFKNLLGIHSPSVVFYAIGGFLIAGLIAGMKAQSISLYDMLVSIGNKIIEIVKGFDIGNLIALGLTAGLLIITNKIVGIVKDLSSVVVGFGNLLTGLGNMFTSFGQGVNNFAKGVKYKGVAAMIKSLAISIGVIVAAIVILGKMDHKQLIQGGNALGLILVALVGVMGALALFSKYLNTVKLPEIGKILAATLGISVAIFIIAQALKTISKIDPENMNSSINGLIACMLALGILMGVLGGITKLLQGTENIEKIGKVFTKIGLSMLLMAVALRMMNKVEDSAIKTLITVFISVGVLLGIIAGLNKWTGNSISKSADTIKAVGVALLLLVVTMKLAGSLKPKAFANMSKVVSIFIKLLFKMMLISKIFKNTEMIRVTGSILMVAIAIGLLALTVKLMSNMQPDKMKNGLKCVSMLSLLVTALIMVSKNSSSYHGFTLIGIAITIAMMAGIVFLLGQMDPKKAAKGLAAVSILTILVDSLLEASKGLNTDKTAFYSLIVLTVMITLLVAALVGLSFIEPKKLLSSTMALASVILSLAVAINSLKNVKKLPKGAIKALVTMVGVIAALGLVMSVLSLIPSDPLRAISNAITLSILLTAMTGILVIMKKTKLNVTKGMQKSIQALAMLIIPLVGFAAALAILNVVDSNKSIQNVVALTALMTAMTLLLKPLGEVGSFVSKNIKDIIAGIIALSAMALPMLAFVGVLQAMSGIKNALKNTIALIALTTAMTLLLIPLSTIGAFIGTGVGAIAIIAGIAALAGMALPMLAFVGVLQAMSGIPHATENCKALTDMMLVFTSCLVAIGLVSPLLVVADIALVGMLAIITAFGVFATAVGALMEKFPKLEEFLDKGVNTMIKIAEGIANIVGSFVKALANSIMDVFPILGTKLSAFMNNGKDFFDGISRINKSTAEGAAIMAAVIAALFAEAIVEKILNFGGKGIDLADLGSKLSEFMNNAKDFFKDLPNVNRNAADGMRIMASVFVELTKAELLENLNNVVKKFAGINGDDLASFAGKFGAVGSGIMAFAQNTEGIKNDVVKKAELTSKAFEALVGAAGLVADLNGRNFWGKLGNLITDGDVEDISTFADRLGDVADGIRDFVTNLPTFTDSNLKTVQRAADAVSAVAKAASTIEKTINAGGSASLGFFSVDVDTYYKETLPFQEFLDRLPEFAEKIKAVMLKLGDMNFMDITRIKTITNFMTSLKSFMTSTKKDINSWNSGQFVESKDMHVSNLQALSEELKAFGEGVKQFAQTLNEIGTDPNIIGPQLQTDPLEVFKSKLQFITVLGDAVKGIDDSSVNRLSTMSQTLQTLFTENLKNIINDFSSGEFNTEQFKTNVGNIVAAYKDILENFKGYDEQQVQSIESTSDAINTITSIDFSNMDDGDITTKTQDYGDAIVKFSEKIKEFITKMNEIKSEDIASAIEKFKSITESISNIKIEDIDNLKSFSAALEETVREGIATFTDGFSNNNTLQSVKNAVETMIKAVYEEAQAEKENPLQSSLQKVLEDVVFYLEELSNTGSLHNSAFTVGTNIVQGLIDGMNSKGSSANTTAYNIGANIIAQLKAGTDSHSPSRAAAKVGSYVGEGLIVGMKKYADKVYDESYRVADQAKLGLSRAIAGVSALISNGIDDEFTIRPVLDLSDIRSGITSMNNMLGVPSIGVAANLNAISSGMKMTRQNSGENNVVSAIDRLGKNLGNVSGDTYNINGISYDDGSEIAEAVQTLIRAARIERRT